MTIDIEEREDTRLTVGRAPVRLAAGGTLHYYVVSCEHGVTELHDNMALTQEAVIGNLVDKHHEETGCQCQPS